MTQLNVPAEEWRPVVGYEGYEVSSHGRVRSYKRNKSVGQLLHPILSFGYEVVQLQGESGSKSLKVHRLVGMAFLTNMTGAKQINHKDGNKQNNHVSNLEWCTCQQNITHAITNGLRNTRGVFAPRVKLNDDLVLEIRELRKQGMQVKHLAESYNVSINAISCIIYGKTWTHLL